VYVRLADQRVHNAPAALRATVAEGRTHTKLPVLVAVPRRNFQPRPARADTKITIGAPR
jgi:hypothetical protein